MSAPLSRVSAAVATADGISQWWTSAGVQGESKEGAELSLLFGQPDPAAVMEVTLLDPLRHVAWTCVGGADEWIGTTLAFDLSPSDDETVVMFSHADWSDSSEFMAHCSARWAYFLLSMRSYVETGRGTPFPDDLKF